MLTILEDSTDELVAVSVTGKFTTADFEMYRSLVTERVEKLGSTRVYFEMVDFDGWSIGSFLENGLFDLLHRNDFGKVAMVGEKRWQEWAARVASPVKKEGIRYFDINEKDLAIKWVKE